MGWPIDNAKLERVRTLMAAEGVDTLVARSPDNVCYLTNYWPKKGYDVAIVPLHGDPTLLVMEPQYEEAQRTAWTADVRPFPFYDPDDARPPGVRAQDVCLEVLRERDRGRVGLEHSQGTQAADRMVGGGLDVVCGPLRAGVRRRSRVQVLLQLGEGALRVLGRADV